LSQALSVAPCNRVNPVNIDGLVTRRHKPGRALFAHDLSLQGSIPIPVDRVFALFRLGFRALFLARSQETRGDILCIHKKVTGRSLISPISVNSEKVALNVYAGKTAVMSNFGVFFLF
jgi:hypothetical protein